MGWGRGVHGEESRESLGWARWSGGVEGEVVGGVMSALLTFRGRHVGWQRRRSASAEEDGKAVKWKHCMSVG